MDQLVSQGAPHEGLSTIRFYAARLRGECREVLGIADATNDEVCDVSEPPQYLPTRRDPPPHCCPGVATAARPWLPGGAGGGARQAAAEAVLALDRDRGAAAAGHAARTDPTLPTRAATTTAAHGSGASAGRPQGHVLQDLLQGGMDKNQANDRLVHKT